MYGMRNATKILICQPLLLDQIFSWEMNYKLIFTSYLHLQIDFKIDFETDFYIDFKIYLNIGEIN